MYRDIASLVSSDSQDVRELLQRLLNVAREYLNMEMAFISEFCDGRRVFRLIDAHVDAVDILTVGASDPLEMSYCQRVVDGRLPGLIRNATEVDEAKTLAVTCALPVGAHLSVPVVFDDGTVYGTFCCFSRTPDYSLDERHINAVMAFGELAARLLDCSTSDRRSYESRRQSLLRMIKEQRFKTVYQPIFELESGLAVGYESLTRFDSDLPLSTEEWFIEAADLNMAYALECAAGKRAMQGMQKIRPSQYLTLNISPETLLHCPDLEAMMGPDLKRLVLEITEHDRIADYSLVTAKLEPLRERGLRLAVDDAGAGYASFRHILQLKPDIIKIDRSLIRGLDEDPAQLALTTAMVTFARATGSSIVAEGVETQGELDVLRDLNVEYVQGYLLGVPGDLPC